MSLLPKTSRKTGQRFAVLSTIGGIGTAALLVLRFPPTQHAFYPRCPVREYLHVDCPGCGATRAFAALLHGHIVAAFHLNALFVCLVPWLAIYAAFSCYRAWTREAFEWPNVTPWVPYALLAITTIFGVVRNLPT